MTDFQSIAPQRRAVPRLSDFGSPFKLYELILETDARELLVGRTQRFKDKGAAKIRDEIEAACLRHLQYYLSLLTVAAVQRHYLAKLALPQASNTVLNHIDAAIASEKELANLSMQVVALDQKTNYVARVLAGRKAELEGLSYDSDLFDPKDTAIGESAFDIYRRGASLEAAGNIHEAEAMYRHAIGAAPRFSLALRGYAGLLRQRDPMQAAHCYSAALDDMPRLTYGLTNTGFFGTKLEAASVYRDFRILETKDEAIAFPIIVGSVDFSNAALRSRLHRFAGLFLLRIRLRLRQKAELSLPPAGKAAGAKASFLGELKKVLLVRAPPLAKCLGFFTRLARSALSLFAKFKSRVRRFIAGTLRSSTIWILGFDKSLFDFVLIDSDADRLKAQIDMIYAQWLAIDSPQEQPELHASARP